MIVEREHDTVGALQLDVLARKNKVGRLRRGSGCDGGGFGVDVDVDRVGDVIDGGGVGHRERRLASHERRNNALKENISVDQWDSTER